MNETIGRLYDCIVEPRLWQSTLSHIAELTDSEIITLAVLDVPTREARFLSAHGDPRVLGTLFHTYSALMPFYHVLHRFEIDEPLDFEAFCALHGPDGVEIWNGSRIQREWFEPNHLRVGANLLVMKRHRTIGAFNTVTSSRSPLGPRAMGLVRELAPHIRRAVTIGDLLEKERCQAGLFQQILESLAHPVVVVTKDMRIVHANPTAEVMLREEGAIRQFSGKLVLNYSRANDAVAHAVKTGHQDEVLLGPSGIDIPLGGHERPSVAHVLPLARRLGQPQFSIHAAAAIFIAAPGSDVTPAIDAVAALFGLTSAEKRVASLVGNGKTRSEIAQLHGVSEHTVKAQLAAIYDKTNTRDQRGLQLLIRELTPPVRRKLS